MLNTLTLNDFNYEFVGGEKNNIVILLYKIKWYICKYIILNGTFTNMEEDINNQITKNSQHVGRREANICIRMPNR